MDTIEYPGAEAVTMDGQHRGMYVRDTSLIGDPAEGHKVQTSNIRYGRPVGKTGAAARLRATTGR